MELLVQYGADVDQVLEQQGSPLHVACSHQHLSTVKKLLELGENVSDLLCKRVSAQIDQLRRCRLAVCWFFLFFFSLAQLVKVGRAHLHS